MVELVAFGPEIVMGPDANDAFGAAPAALPPGASTTPVAMAPAAPAPVANVAPVTTPHTAFLAGPPPAPAAPVEHYVHPGGGVFTRDQLIAANWTEAQITALPRA
jgi:hypothetical protein